MIKDDIFKHAIQVAVIGGNVDSTGVTSQTVKVCNVIQVGEKDIMVEDPSGYSSKFTIVPKCICVPIAAKAEDLAGAKILDAKLGDLILTVQREDWKKKDATKTVGILYEVKYELGKPSLLTVLVGNEFKTIKNENVLVLQTIENMKK